MMVTRHLKQYLMVVLCGGCIADLLKKKKVSPSLDYHNCRVVKGNGGSVTIKGKPPNWKASERGYGELDDGRSHHSVVRIDLGPSDHIGAVRVRLYGETAVNPRKLHSSNTSGRQTMRLLVRCWT